MTALPSKGAALPGEAWFFTFDDVWSQSYFSNLVASVFTSVSYEKKRIDSLPVVHEHIPSGRRWTEGSSMNTFLLVSGALSVKFPSLI